jgi:hypothetical protein
VLHKNGLFLIDGNIHNNGIINKQFQYLGTVYFEKKILARSGHVSKVLCKVSKVKLSLCLTKHRAMKAY